MTTDRTRRPTGQISPRSSAVLHRIDHAGAKAGAGVMAAVAAVAWFVMGVFFRFPDWWQVALYSASALVTFVMVFVIQHTQHRQVVALQRKLDELIRTTRWADNALIAVENAPAHELDTLAERYLSHREASYHHPNQFRGSPVPSDNTTLVEVLDDYQLGGSDADFTPLEGGIIGCAAWGSELPAERFTMLSRRRLEGASDPDDMMAVVATVCPQCAARAS